MPSESVSLAGKFKWFCIFQFESYALLQFISEPFNAFFFQYIFQAGVFAVGAISEITVDRQDSLGNVFYLITGDVANHICFPRKCVRVVMAHTQAAAGREVVTNQFVILGDRNKSETIGKEIDIVQRRDCECRLKFTREIGFSIERILVILVLLQIQLNSLNPNGMVGLSGGL